MSALTLLGGDGLMVVDNFVQQNGFPAFNTTGVIDASTEKVGIAGRIWHPTIKTGTINIRKVHFRLGALTFNALSTIRCSLQSISATAGPPYQPDGSQDQTYDFATGTGLTGSAWNSTGNLSADRAVDLGAYGIGDANSPWLAVVFEYTTFTAADSFILSGISPASSAASEHLIGGSPLLNTGSWAALNNGTSIIAFELDDGSFAFMEGGRPISAISSTAVGNASAARAAGLKFKFPVEVNIDCAGLLVAVQNAADGNFILYDSDGTTALRTLPIDNDAVISTSARVAVHRFAPVTLAANTFYRLVFVASVTTTTTVYYVSANSAALMDGFAGGQNFHWTSRDSGGTWTDVTTQRPMVYMRVSSIHDGAGGGGGMVRHPGMSGNLNG